MRNRPKGLREAVNAYLLAQNTHGYKDGAEAHGGDECAAARRQLCEFVYRANERAAAKGKP